MCLTCQSQDKAFKYKLLGMPPETGVVFAQQVLPTSDYPQMNSYEGKSEGAEVSLADVQS